MKILKTDDTAAPAKKALLAKFPGKPHIELDDAGKIRLSVSAYINDDQGDHTKYQVVLTGPEIERVLEALANPQSDDASRAVSKAMSGSLRSLLRLTAMASGTMPQN